MSILRCFATVTLIAITTLLGGGASLAVTADTPSPTIKERDAKRQRRPMTIISPSKPRISKLLPASSSPSGLNNQATVQGLSRTPIAIAARPEHIRPRERLFISVTPD